MKRAEFKCQADTAEVWLYDFIGQDAWGDGISAKMFCDDLAALEGVEQLTVRINCPGGSVWDANAIYNALCRFDARIEVGVDGVAASGGSLVAMAGDSIYMAENAHLMVHEAAGSVYGRAAEHRNIADVLDKLNEGMNAAYRRGSDRHSEAEVAAWLAEEKWFDAAEAVEAGLADEIGQAFELEACIPRGVYKATPKQLEMAEAGSKSKDAESWRVAARERELILAGP